MKVTGIIFLFFQLWKLIATLSKLFTRAKTAFNNSCRDVNCLVRRRDFCITFRLVRSFQISQPHRTLDPPSPSRTPNRSPVRNRSFGSPPVRSNTDSICKYAPPTCQTPSCITDKRRLIRSSRVRWFLTPSLYLYFSLSCVYFVSVCFFILRMICCYSGVARSKGPIQKTETTAHYR